MALCWVSTDRSMSVISLLDACMESVVLVPSLLQYAVSLGLPSSIHTWLFSIAAQRIPAYGVKLRESVTTLVATWPRSDFVLKDMIPKHDSMGQSVSIEDKSLLFNMVIEGLMGSKASSQLHTLDVRGVLVPSLFQIPMLSIVPEERCSDDVLSEIRDKCRLFCGDQDDLESALSWKLTELTEKPGYTFEAKGPIDIVLEVQMDLSEWYGMVDEMLGLLLQHRTPFRFIITKLSIHNFDIKQAKHLRWLLALIDKKTLTSLGVHGKRKSLALLFWELTHDLQLLTELTWFALSTRGPKLLKNLVDLSQPSDDEILTRTQHVLQSWSNLTEIYLNRVTITNQLETILTALPGQLKTLHCYANNLSREDVKCLSRSHHIHSITLLNLEYTCLRGMEEELCQMIENASSLEELNLKNTELKMHEKIAIVTRLQVCEKLHTLILHDNEDMLSSSAYQDIVAMACGIRLLREFYIFPFNYRPFEIFYRSDVQQACYDILATNGRNDIALYY